MQGMGCRAGADEKQDLQGLNPRALCESSPNSVWGAGDLHGASAGRAPHPLFPWPLLPAAAESLAAAHRGALGAARVAQVALPAGCSAR